MPNFEQDGPSGVSLEVVAAMLDCLGAVCAASPLRRAAELVGRLSAVFAATAAAVDVATADGPPVRLAATGDLPDELAEPLSAHDARAVDVNAGDTDTTAPDAAASAVPVVRRHAPGRDGGPAALRSVFDADAVVSAITVWRPAPFRPIDAEALRLLHPRVARALAPAPGRPDGMAGQVLQLMLFGLPEKEIARRLNRSTHTVHAYIKRVYRHYGVRSRPELIANHFAAKPNDD